MKKVGILLIGLSLAGCEVGDRDNIRALLTLLGMGAGGTLGWFTGGDRFTNKFLWSAMLAAGGWLVVIIWLNGSCRRIVRNSIAQRSEP